ncbi:protein MODIFIED TRANSPORT TO THE VACUOLE 1 [Pelomyxa schiedti]|nr:protein MODIFIED TRANSPORT TO THE VACUOLE 1 [Pelomyxa schiedti]
MIDAFSQLSSAVGSVAGIVLKATSDDTDPTPGYVYIEINKLSATASHELVDYLIKRLHKNSPFVKSKVLKVVKHGLDGGSPSFRSELQPKVDEFRHCLSFSGPPDPLRGDEPYVTVRKEAQDVINMLFQAPSPRRDNMKDSPHTAVTAYSTRTSMPAIEGGYGGMGSGGSLNTNSGTSTAVSALSQAGTAVVNASASAVSTAASAVAELIKKVGGKTDEGAYSSSIESPSSGRYTPAAFKYNQPSSNYGSFEFHNSAPKTYYERQNMQLPATPPTHRQPNESRTEDSDSPEYILVHNFATDSGIRVIPTQTELIEFVTSAKGLEKPVVIDETLKALSDKSWKVRMKALCAIEAMLNDPEFARLQQYFEANVESIRILCEYSQSSVREKATNIISRLDPKSALPVAQTHPQPNLLLMPEQQEQAQQTPANLLLFGSEISTPASPSTGAFSFILDNTPSQHTTTHTDSGMGNMFNGLSVDSNPPQTNFPSTSHSANKLLDFTTEDLPSNPITELIYTPNSTFTRQPVPTPAPTTATPTPQTKSNTAINANALFDSPPPSAALLGVGDLLLINNPAPRANTNKTSASSSTNTTAFSFINSCDSTYISTTPLDKGKSCNDPHQCWDWVKDAMQAHQSS